MSKNIDYGVVALKNIPVVSSRKVARVFGKEHKNVLAAIENSGCSEEFRRLNFKPSSYRNAQNKKQPEILMTKDGFTFIVMGFTGKKAAWFKEAYINRFNEMEQYIKSRYIARLESRELSDAVEMLHDPAMHYHYSNEYDMINRIVLGMSSKQFKLMHGLPKDALIRDHMTPQQIDAVQKLQSFDAHLAQLMPDYKQRQALLLDYYKKISAPKQLELTGT